MNKKILLGLGTLPLSIVPIATMVSCGCSSTTNEIIEITKIESVSQEITLENVTGDSLQSVATLEKLFTGITAENVTNVTASINPTDPVADGVAKHTITLTAGEGFAFDADGNTTLVSSEFVIAAPVAPEVIDIVAIPDVTATVFTLAEFTGDSLQSVATLEKLFTGITAENVTNVTASINPTDPVADGVAKHTITLTAAPGFAFDADGNTTLVSSEFVIAAPDPA